MKVSAAGKHPFSSHARTKLTRMQQCARGSKSSPTRPRHVSSPGWVVGSQRCVWRRRRRATILEYVCGAVLVGYASLMLLDSVERGMTADRIRFLDYVLTYLRRSRSQFEDAVMSFMATVYNREWFRVMASAYSANVCVTQRSLMMPTASLYLPCPPCWPPHCRRCRPHMHPRRNHHRYPVPWECRGSPLRCRQTALSHARPWAPTIKGFSHRRLGRACRCYQLLRRRLCKPRTP